jgi:hypothetical protein
VKTFTRSRKIFGAALAALLSISGVAGTAQAFPALGDYDGDGDTDLAVALVQGDSTIWLSRSTPVGNSFYYLFNKKADAFVSGVFYDDAKTYPGIVTNPGGQGPLNWTIKNQFGQDVNLSYGLPGDTIPNQGDLDCDGRTDLIVTRPGSANWYNGFRLWYVALSSSGKVQEQVFGLATDQIAVADINGDHCDELIALRGDYTWYAAGLFGGNALNVQWGLPGDIPLLPQDINGDGQPDFIVVRVFNGKQFALVRYNVGQSDIIPLGGPTSVPLVGKFTGRNSFGWQQRDTGFTAVKQQDGSDSVFPFGINTNVMIRPDGSVVTPNQDGKTSLSQSTSNSTVTAGSIGSCTNIVSISSLKGVLYKPINEHGGRGPTLIVKNPNERTGKKRIEIRDVNCKVIGALGLFATDAQYGARYYSKSGGSNHTHTQLHSLAVKAGSTNVLIEGKGKWIKLNDPEDRQGAL